MELFAVIMAGGVGARFWPRSKKSKPKQLIRIFGENTMIQETVNRLDGLIKKENILVITNTIQKERIEEQLPEIPTENIIAEPFGKNTAACIGLASVIIQSKSKDAISIILPADHLIQDIEKFQSTILKAVHYAENNNGLVTIGINPTRPETGYGYIQIIDEEVSEGIFKVQTFAEKPNLLTAKRFIKSGDFLWNSGMFIWKIETIMNEFNNHLPELYEGLLKIQDAIGKDNFNEVLTSVYGQLINVSIDYGIMEKSSNVFLTRGDFNWNDVGSWEAVFQLSEKNDDGNTNIGDVYTENTYGSYVFSPKKFTAIVGLENLIVINTKDALLICSRENTQDVKNVVEYLKLNNREELL